MIRTLDATDFNRIAEHPEVRPWLGFADPRAEIDLAHIVSSPRNFAFLTENRDGGYLMVWRQSGLYDVHTLSLPSGRGRPLLRLMREMLAFMFTATDCVEVVTCIPDGNEAARRWSDHAGFRDTFRREAFFPLMGESVGAQFRSLAYGDWVMRDPENKAYGDEFHRTLAETMGHASHPDDATHDHWVGATLRGCLNQTTPKAVALYNRWAVTAHYQPVAILSITPPTIDIGGEIVQIFGQAFTVLDARRLLSSQGETSCLRELAALSRVQAPSRAAS